MFSDMLGSARWLPLVLLPCALVAAAPPHDQSYYLPGGVAYDESIPTPRAVLGYEVGEWHVRHDQLVEYYRALAEASPRVTLERYGLTHEARPLLLATVTSPENHARLGEIRRRHLAALSADGERRGDSGGDASPDRPVVVWMGYSVHGNESSGANASLLVGYHLAAAQGAQIERLLRGSVVLIDPCINPDGLSRFAQWANSHRGKQLVADPAHREHREVWPGGRTNHYWFDLNRDWLLLTHPESRGRLEQFHRWRPNIVTDFHEMGTNSTFFFQPGVPARQNPNTPPRNLELTRKLSRYHASILDRAGSLYFTEERFDDFYYGKGSTYPDVNGGIGILFEQASSRGHLQESTYGLLSFPFTIRNQFLTSLSTLDGALSMSRELLDYQTEFYRSSTVAAEGDPVRAWVFGSPHDPSRNERFIDILLRHRIEVAHLARDVRTDGLVFTPEHGYVVPLAQSQYRLIRTLFQTQTEFADNTFYDVSTWTLPLSFDMPYAALAADAYTADLPGGRVSSPPRPAARAPRKDSAYAYLFEWERYYAPRAAQRLLAAGIRLRAAMRPFEAETDRGRHAFSYGTIVAPMGIQDASRDTVRALMGKIAEEDGVDVLAVESGLTAGGIDLGSPNMGEVKPPKPVVLVGSGTSGYEVGEIWHLLDTRYGIELSMLELEDFGRTDLNRYSHLILVSGAYDALGADDRGRLRDWIRGGGVLVSTGGSVPWVETNVLERKAPVAESPAAGGSGAAAPPKPEEKPKRVAYADYERHRAEELIRGTILQARIDVTHPLGFGYQDDRLPVFRNSSTLMEPEKDPIATMAWYADAPLLSGFISKKNLERVRGTAVVNATRMGRGAVIRIIDNLNFRGVWYGTSKLFVNTLFFGGLIKETRALDG